MQGSNTQESMDLPVMFLKRSYELIAEITADHNWNIGQPGDRERTIDTFQLIGNTLNANKGRPAEDLIPLTLSMDQWVNYGDLLDSFSDEADDADPIFVTWLNAVNKKFHGE